MGISIGQKHVLVLPLQQTDVENEIGKANTMDFGAIYHFLFETYVGIGVLVAISLVVCIAIAAVLELRTRKTYVDRGPSDDDDEWSLFDDGEGAE